MKRLNLGCGNDYMEGWVNVDISDNVKKDKKLDMNKPPYDFPSKYFDFILAKETIEHIERNNFIKIMQELHRISKSGGIIYIKSPLNKFWNDPTHKNPMNLQTFQYFCSEEWIKIYKLPRFKIIRQRITSDIIPTIPKILAYCFPFNILSLDFEVYLEVLK